MQYTGDATNREVKKLMGTGHGAGSRGPEVRGRSKYCQYHSKDEEPTHWLPTICCSA